MATKKLNIDLTKPISVESQMALVEYARQHRPQMLKGISEWLNDKLPLCNGNANEEWQYELDSRDMKEILYCAATKRAWKLYCDMDTIVSDWFIEIASGVYEAEEGYDDEPVLKTYRIHYTLNGYVDIEAEYEDIAREKFYDEDYEKMVWDSVLENELVIMDSEEVSA